MNSECYGRGIPNVVKGVNFLILGFMFIHDGKLTKLSETLLYNDRVA